MYESTAECIRMAYQMCLSRGNLLGYSAALMLKRSHSVSETAYSKMSRRIVLPPMLAYIVAYLGRVNSVSPSCRCCSHFISARPSMVSVPVCFS